MDKSYAVLYSEDNFQGVSVPRELKHILEKIEKDHGYYVICEIIDDYEQYRNEEVEMSRHAREESGGTKHLENEAEIISFFNMRFDLNIGNEVPLSKIDNKVMSGILTESMVKAVGANDMEVFYKTLDKRVGDYLKSTEFEIEITERTENQWVLYLTRGNDSKRFMIDKLFF